MRPEPDDVVEVDLLELLHALKALVHRLEVGEHAAEPTLVDVGHADALGLLLDRLLRLALGADEQDRAAAGDGVLDELVAGVDVGERLLQVDDVDAVALGEDESLHLGVPATGLVPEVDAALEQLTHGDDGHGRSSLWRRGARPGCRTAGWRCPGARTATDPLSAVLERTRTASVFGALDVIREQAREFHFREM